jgi:hypothetical protein
MTTAGTDMTMSPTLGNLGKSDGEKTRKVKREKLMEERKM